ncbi:MAG: hypothetical protein NTY90_04560 [Candidatus Micrarchaeota archaeon]|nr:hypothetical protein [Candidatus Micrarchaeota archaeon]
MEKKTILWAFTVFIILAFMLETFIVFMWTPSSQEQGATPTPQAQANFSGTGEFSATILDFEDGLLVDCNLSDSTAAAGAVSGLPGVKQVITMGSNWLGIVLNGTLPDTEFNALLAGLNSSLSKWCIPIMWRWAFIEVETNAVFYSQLENATVYPKDINDYSSFCQYTRNCHVARVYASSAKNESVTLLGTVSLTDGRLQTFDAQQLKTGPGTGAVGESEGNQSVAANQSGGNVSEAVNGPGAVNESGGANNSG